MRLKLLGLATIMATVAACAGAPPAHAGTWRLDPRLCPDLREDIRDARVTYSRRDAREDRRDRRYVNCPARAWVYVPGRYERAKARPAVPVYSSIYVNKKGHYYGIRGSRRVRLTVVY